MIASTLFASWLGMQAVHEAGHALAATLTGGRVERVVLHPLTISRNDLAANPHPLPVVWAGPLVGVAGPLVLWGVTAVARVRWAFLPRFFAGFCLVANGLYIGVGSFGRVGDCGELLRHGATLWHLWAFGVAAAPLGVGLWHGQGPHFGLGPAAGCVDRGAAYGSAAVCVALLALGFAVGGG